MADEFPEKEFSSDEPNLSNVESVVVSLIDQQSKESTVDGTLSSTNHAKISSNIDPVVVGETSTSILGSVPLVEHSIPEEVVDSSSHKRMVSPCFQLGSDQPKKISESEPIEPNSLDSTFRSTISGGRSLVEEEILSSIEQVVDWAEESDEENEEIEGTEQESLDFDRDKRNPQYIPRGGQYFLHDDRDAEFSEHSDNDESSDETKKLKPEEFDAAEGQKDVKSAVPILKKSLSRNEAKIQVVAKLEEEEPESARWEHDLFDPDSQTAKSKDEIRGRYGFDIRDEQHPPRGRRRYGRPDGQRRFNGRRRGRGGRSGHPSVEGEQPKKDEEENIDPNKGSAAIENVGESLPDTTGRGRFPVSGRRGPRAPTRATYSRPPLSHPRGGDQQLRPLRQPERDYQEDKQRDYYPPAPVQRDRYLGRREPNPFSGSSDPGFSRQFDAREQINRRRQQRPMVEEYEYLDDSQEQDYRGRVDNSFQSRVFFSRGRGPRRGNVGPARTPGPTRDAPPEYQQRQPPISTFRVNRERNFDGMPSQNDRAGYSGMAADVRKPTQLVQSGPAQSKRYSSRKGFHVGMNAAVESDDVRASGTGRSGYPPRFEQGPQAHSSYGDQGYSGYNQHYQHQYNYNSDSHPQQSSHLQGYR